MSINVAGGDLQWDAGIDLTGFRSQLAEIRNGLNSLADNQKKNSNDIADFAKKAATAAAGYFSIQAASNFVQSMVSVRGEFQQIEVAYRTMLGSKEKADQLMAESVKLAAVTPFGLQEVASGSKQLLAYGFAAKEITQNLEMLGNVASGVGSGLNDVVYLYGTLKASGRVTQMDINQFAGRGIPVYKALADTMKITTAQVREYVSAGKIGFPDIEKAFKSLTAEGGQFYDLMREQSKTLTGQLSNLSDAWSVMLNELGKSNEGIFASGISGATALVENYQKVLDIVGALVVGYGTYRAALLVSAAVTSIATYATAGFTAAEILQYYWTTTLTKAQKLLNLTMLSNPYVAVAAALAALGTYLYLASEKTDNLAKSQENLTSIQDTAKKSTIDQKQKLQDLIKVADDETRTLSDRKDALNKINNVSPEFLGSLTLARLRTEEGKKAIDAYNNSLDIMALKQASFDKRVDLQKEKADVMSGKAEDKLSWYERGLANLKTGKSGNFNDAEYEKERKVKADAIDKQLKDISDYENKAIAEFNSKKPEGVKVVRTVSVIDKDIDDLKALQKTAATKKEYADKQVEINQLEKEKIAITGESSKASAKASKEETDWQQKRLDFQQKINDAYANFNLSQLSQNAQEIAQNKAKYDALRKELIEYNKEARKAGKKELGASALAQINSLEAKEKYSIEYNQQTKAQAEAFDEQKRLYDDYEQYKTTFGKEAALKRFGEELKTNQQLLTEQSKIVAVLSVKSAVGGGLNAGETARLEQAKKNAKELQEIEEKRYEEAYKSAETYLQKAQSIENDYQSKRKSLGENATTEQLRNLQIERDNRVKANNEANAFVEGGYADLMENMLVMTKQAVLDRLKVIREGYENNSTLTPRQKADLIAVVDSKISEVSGNNNPFSNAINSIKEYRKALKETNGESLDVSQKAKAMFGSISGAVQAGSQIFGEVTNALSSLGIGTDEATQKVFQNVQGILGGVGDLAKGIASGNPVDIIKGSISILTNAIDLFNTKDKKLEKQIVGYKNQLKSLGDAYAVLDGKVKNAVGESIYEDQSKQIANLKSQERALSAARNAESGKKKADKGKIDEYNKQLAEIPTKIEEIQKSIAQGLIQTTFKEISNSLADAFTDAFKSGEDGIEKMDGVFKSFISNAIKNSLKLKLIEPIISGMTKDLEAYALSNNNSIIGFDFNSYKDAIGKKQKEFTDVLEANKEFFTDDSKGQSKTNTAQTGIVRTQLTEQTGQRIDGIMRAQYDAAKLTNSLLTPVVKGILDLFLTAKSNLDLAIKIEANTLRTANNTDLLNIKLDAIISNTKQPIVRGLP